MAWIFDKDANILLLYILPLLLFQLWLQQLQDSI